MLRFIGLGLHDETGISLRGLSEVREADFVFAEFYTSVMPGLSPARLEALIGRGVTILSREDVEEKAEEVILERARRSDVALLVPGDPMNATTHVDLRLRAEKRHVRTSLTHAASITSAVSGATGLQSYKFGRTVTLPIVGGGLAPESPYEWVRDNFQRGLHSLILLDLQAADNAYLGIPEALRQLSHLEERKGAGLFTPTRLIVGAARVGSPDMEIKGGTISDLSSHDFGAPPHCLVVPGKLHFMEKEALRVFAKVDEECLRGSE